MSDDESADGLEDLQELMAAYGHHEQPKKQTEKPVKKETETEYVEVPMEKVVFGDKQAFLANLAKSVGRKRPQYKEEAINDGEDDENYNDEGNSKKAKPAWTDSDDDELEVGEVKRQTKHTGPLNHLRKDKSYKEYLTARFQRTINQPKWATLEKKNGDGGDSDDSQDEQDEALLKTVGFIDHKAKTKSLQPKTIQIKRVKDLNRATYSEGVIQSIQFHPTSTAALVAGESCIASIYSVNGTKNEKLHNIRFPKFPVTCARIAPCGTKAFFGSKATHYYTYDLLHAKESKLRMPVQKQQTIHFDISPCGKYLAVVGTFGAIHLLSANSNELLHSFKQEGQCRSFCFTADSKRLLCCGSSCNINVLSLRQQCIEHCFIDDGCVNGRKIALSPNQRLLATGSNEGVVNVYDHDSVYRSRSPKPVKCFMNLRTAVGDLKFNHTSEILAMSSRQVPNAIKLAHFPSATVYSNFPGRNEHLGLVNTMEFSPHSGYLGIGSMGKKAPLFRLKYFKNY